MLKFTCSSCKKILELENRIYEKVYKDYKHCLDCRSHGGKREGAGRPSLGTTKKVSLTLPDEIWERLEDHRGNQPMSAFLRELVMENYE